MDTFVYKDHKKLRCGYTTGTCAALAAQGAVRFLLTGSWKETEEIMTPKGIPVCVSLEEKTSGDSWAECAVRKDAGDDYDVTNGILVYARAEFVKDKNFYEKVQMSHLESSGFGAAGEKPGLSPENQKQQKKANAAHQKDALPESLVRIDGGIGIGRITKSSQ
jgi:cobalt-precorrin-5B (C1)-methyltransferase